MKQTPDQISVEQYQYELWNQLGRYICNDRADKEVIYIRTTLEGTIVAVNRHLRLLMVTFNGYSSFYCRENYADVS